MSQAEEILKRLKEGGLEEADQLQPVILAHQNIDLNKVKAWWSGHANDAWAPEIEGKLKEGYVIVRIQTEFHGTIHGHNTMIYMAKMRS